MRLDESGRYVSIEEDAANAAMAVSPGGLIGTTAKTAARALTTSASRSAGLYDPPAKAPRPFEADYPNAEGVANEAGQLVKDIEGRPLGAEFIVGRRELGGADEPLLAPGVLAEEYGIPVERVPARRIGGDAGRLVMGRVPETAASSARIAVDRSLSAAASDRVIAHEVGHLIDELAGRIDTSGLNIELRQIYNTLNTGEERARHLTGPQHWGYRGEDISLELMAEAIRAYLADPNYIKTVAPKTAARIRAAVNEHPRLREHIQFNVQGALPPTDDDESGPWQKYSAASSHPLPDPLDELAPLMPLLRTMPR
jgi:hypothetical protein